MFNPEKLLGGLIRSSARGRRGGLGGLVSGGVALGALGVAMEAFEHFVNKPQNSASPPPLRTGSPPPMSGSPPPPPPIATGMPGISPPPMPGAQPSEKVSTAAAEPAGTDYTVLLIRAMIAAANADGIIDQAERNAILERLQSADLSSEEHAFITRELLAPADLESIVNRVDSAGLARQVYTVSLMAIEVDTEAERHYMQSLAERLGLDAATVEQIERSLEMD